MADNKIENPHLKVRPVLIFWAIVVVLFTAAVFFMIGYNYGQDNPPTTSSETVNSDSAGVPPVPEMPSATATTDVTADWKTYTNDTYGFSFKYPSAWNITTDERSTSEPVYDVIFDTGNSKVYNAASRQMWINIYKTSDAAPTTLAQEKATIQDNVDRGFRSATISDLKIGGQDAVSYNYTDSKDQEIGNLQYSVIDSSTFYHLSFYNNAATASQILSTFQFTK